MKYFVIFLLSIKCIQGGYAQVVQVPINLSSSNIGSDSFTAHWESLESGYTFSLDFAIDAIFNDQTMVFHNVEAGAHGTTNTMNVRGFSSNTKYYFRVCVINGSDKICSESSAAFLTVPATPKALAASKVSTDGFRANWEGTADHFRVDVASDTVFTDQTIVFGNLDAGSNNYLDMRGFFSESTYYYRVRAINSTGSSSYSTPSPAVITLKNTIPPPSGSGSPGQEYTYDGNGNLSSDLNKGIASIHYNHLDRPDTILYSDGRKIVYVYTAFGVKLEERVFSSPGDTHVQTRGYAAQFLYRNDTLREIQHEDGRAVPSMAGNDGSSWEYQYHIKDHLGNVRTTLTSKQDIDSGRATLESSNTNAEQNKFLGYENARLINSILFDHTKTGDTHYSQRLNGSANEKHGVARSLSVMPGDTVRLEVYAKYVDPVSSNLQPALAGFLSQIAQGMAPVGTVIDGAGYASSGSTPFAFAGMNGTSGETGTNPKAYLNWLVFDRNYIFKSGGFQRMSGAGKENGSNVAHEKLAKELLITEPGYVYVYVSNEEATPLEVYFDDLTVTQVKGPVMGENDYDPFGLTFNEYSRENAVPNNFLFNGKEEQKDFDLNWYDYGARMYDAALGRWHVIDPMAEKFVSWSPYNYVLNNPVSNIDPDGKQPAQTGVITGGPGNDDYGDPGEVIEITSLYNPSDVAYLNRQNALLDRAFFLLGLVSEHRRIIGDLKKKLIKIYIAGVPGASIKKDKPSSKGTTKGITLVLTPSSSEALKNLFDPLKGLLKDTFSSFAIFSSVDIDADVKSGKAIGLTVVASDGFKSVYEMMFVVDHELDAHINDFSGNNDEASEKGHDTFGSAFAIHLTPSFDPNTQQWSVNLQTGGDMKSGSAADRLANELRDLYQHDLNTRQADINGSNGYHY